MSTKISPEIINSHNQSLSDAIPLQTDVADVGLAVHDIADEDFNKPTSVKSLSVRHISKLSEVQHAVSTLLEYVVEKADFNISDDFLRQVIPLLRIAKENLTEAEEIELWSAYNKLSNMTYPVTVDSLSIAKEIYCTRLEAEDFTKNGNGVLLAVSNCRRELKYTLFITSFFVILFFLVHGYSIIAEESLQIVDKAKTDFELVQHRIDDIRQSNKNIDENDPLLSQLQTQLSVIEVKSGNLKFLPIYSAQKCENNGNFYARISCLDEVARFVLLLLSSHILPFILGFLGAVTALVRQSLDDLKNKSLKHNWSGKIYLRLFLGGLLGEISGIIFTPSLQELEGLKISLVFVAFLMGYSTDLAFAVFDRIMSSVEEAIKPESKTIDAVDKQKNNK